jgi:NhaP-type Na+/H+ or K+/H+ antiporter
MLVGAAFGQFRPIAAIPMSAWTIAVSATGGLMLRAMLANNVISDDWYMKTSSTFLNLGLLPIIIFASGWSLNHLNFISQLEHIAIFAVFGTLIAFIFTGGAMCTLGAYEFHMIDDVRSNFVFAALISAVDPVATLSTLAKLGLDMSQPLLHTMIFGESVVNDAVAIVLFKAINHGSGHLEAHAVAYDIAKLLFGSWAFGHVAACGLIFLMRCARLPGNTVPETLYIVGSAWFIFALAEGFELSGIIANLWAGTIFKMYGSQLLEEEGIELTSHFLEVAAEMSDTMVFMLCGVSSALVTSFRAIWFATFSCFVCLFGRGLSTSVCAVISNGVKRSTGAPENHQLHFAHQFMMWHAGLRGGIALVLALEVDASWCHYKATIINTTFLIICLYLLAFGSTTELMLRKFGFSKAPTFEEEDPTSPSFGTHGPSPTGAKSHSAAASPSSARSEGGKIEHKGSSAEEDAQLWQEVQQGEPSLKIRWVKASNEFHEMILVGDRGMLLRKRKAAQKHWHQLQQHARKSAPAQNIGADAEAALPPIPQYKSTPNAFGGRSGRQLSSTPGV